MSSTFLLLQNKTTETVHLMVYKKYALIPIVSVKKVAFLKSIDFLDKLQMDANTHPYRDACMGVWGRKPLPIQHFVKIENW